MGKTRMHLRTVVVSVVITAVVAAIVGVSLTLTAAPTEALTPAAYERELLVATDTVAATTETYDLDALNRLTEVDYGTASESYSYDPTLGRFLSADTVRPDTLRTGGTGTGGWNQYTYAENNPTTATDPSGHVSITDNALVNRIQLLSIRAQQFLGTSAGACLYGAAENIAEGVAVGGASPAGLVSDGTIGCAIELITDPPGRGAGNDDGPNGGRSGPPGGSSATEAVPGGSNRAIVIGEDMEGRVIPKDHELGADYYDPPVAPRNQWMENNRKWINDRMDEGCTIYNCGPAPGRSNYPNPTSPYYQMELDEIAKRNYPIIEVR